MNEDKGNLIKRADLIFIDDFLEKPIETFRFKKHELSSFIVPNVGDSIEINDRYYDIIHKSYKYTSSKDFWVYATITVRVKEI